MLEPLRPGDGPDTRMGLGWRVTTSKGVRTMWSSGRADGYRAFMGFDPDARVAVVALTNAATDVGVDDIGWHILDPSRLSSRSIPGSRFPPTCWSDMSDATCSTMAST